MAIRRSKPYLLERPRIAESTLQPGSWPLRSCSGSGGACAGCATRCARRWRRRASSARHESWVRATTDWRRLFARSIGGVLRLGRGDLDAAAAGWTTWPRICGTVRAANGRRCLPGHKARDVANRTTPCGERPKYPIQGRQQRALPFSLKRCCLHSERCDHMTVLPFMM